MNVARNNCSVFVGHRFTHAREPVNNELKRDLMEKYCLKKCFPDLAIELECLLRQEEEHQLAEQIAELHIVDRCRCKEDFCGMFFTTPKPDGAWGPKHRNVTLDPESGEIALDVVDEKITAVEILFRADFRERLFQLLP